MKKITLAEYLKRDMLRDDQLIVEYVLDRELDICEICAALTATTIKSVCFRHCWLLSDESIARLAKAIRVNASVTRLELNDVELTDEHAVALADALKHNTTLTTLNLECNQIGDAGALSLADALKHNKTLTDINLCANQIGDAGLAMLAEAVKGNKTIRYAYFLWNNTLFKNKFTLRQAGFGGKVYAALVSAIRRLQRKQQKETNKNIKTAMIERIKLLDDLKARELRIAETFAKEKECLTRLVVQTKDNMLDYAFEEEEEEEEEDIYDFEEEEEEEDIYDSHLVAYRVARSDYKQIVKKYLR